MFSIVTKIHAERPQKSIWQRLRSFTDVKANVGLLEFSARSRGEKIKGNDKNFKKQATQIAYCIRQAEEYFLAASHVNLPTRPLLLYYGASSLGNALVLLRRNGEDSIDARRKASRHNHHGLETIKFPSNHTYEMGPKAFYQELAAQMVAREKTSSDKPAAPRVFNQSSIERQLAGHEFEPWGLFSLFYQSLNPDWFVLERRVTQGAGIEVKYSFAMPYTDIAPVSTLLPRSFSVAELLGALPDMYSALPLQGWKPDLYRGSHHCTAAIETLIEIDGSQSQDWACDDNFFIDGILEAQQNEIVSFYARKAPHMICSRVTGANLHFRSVYKSKPMTAPASFHYYPDIAEDIGGRHFYIAKPEGYIMESAAIYIVLFSLGMLARYHPDIWMKHIDSDVRIASVASEFLEIAERKFPLLLLDQLSSSKHIIAP